MSETDDLSDHTPDDELSPEQLAQRTASLRRQVTAVGAGPCVGCGTLLCGHEALLCVVLGARHQPRCLGCLAKDHGEAPPLLAERALQWIVRRQCFLAVWRAAEHGLPAVADRPPCLFGAAAPPPSPPPAPLHDAPVHDAPPAPAGAPTEPAASYDAGQLGCGELVLELRSRLRALPPGALLRVVAHDPAAPIDLPAWCGLTGHTLVHATHPDYWIRRRGQP